MKYTRYAVSSAEADIASGRADQDILIWEKSTNAAAGEAGLFERSIDRNKAALRKSREVHEVRSPEPGRKLRFQQGGR